MKTASDALRSLLASRAFYAADLFTLLLASPLPVPGGGTISALYFTFGDRDIVANGSTYLSPGPGRPSFERFGGSAEGTCSWKRGLEVDTLSFDVDPADAVIGSMPFLTACRTGIFDGAEVTLERAYMPTYGDTSAGTVVMFVGRVAEIDAGRCFATFQIASHLELLNQQLPRNLYQASCGNALFDSSCGLSRAAYAVNGTVAAGSTVSAINTAALAQATGWFDLGVITFTSGPNAGLSRTVKAYTAPGSISVISPFPFAPQPGDTFTALPGCAKTSAVCKAKFSNLSRFRGMPFIPDASTAN